MNVTEDALTIYYRYSGAQPHAVTSLDGCSGSSPPTSGNWTIDVNTQCGKSAVGVANVEVQSGKKLDLTRSVLHVDGTLHVVGNLSLEESNVGLADNNDYEYDDNGNIQTDGAFWYIYNDANQLYEVREGTVGGDLVSRYLYNHEGRRTIKKEYSGGSIVNITYYVGRDYEVQNHSGTTHYVAYIMANGEMAAKNDSGTYTYYHNDHLTGTNLVTDENGDVGERTRYYPFGSVLKGGNSKYTYTGQESDKDTGLMYYGARYYSPTLRTFTSPDTHLQDIYDPQLLNRYSYTRNNPLKYVDPDGHDIVCAQVDADAGFVVSITGTTNRMDTGEPVCTCIAYDPGTGVIEKGTADSIGGGVGTPSIGVKQKLLIAPGDKYRQLEDIEGWALVSGGDVGEWGGSVGVGVVTPVTWGGFDRENNMIFYTFGAPDINLGLGSASTSFVYTKTYLHERYTAGEIGEAAYQRLLNEFNQLQRRVQEFQEKYRERIQGTPAWRPWYLGGTRPKPNQDNNEEN